MENRRLLTGGARVLSPERNASRISECGSAQNNGATSRRGENMWG